MSTMTVGPICSWSTVMCTRKSIRPGSVLRFGSVASCIKTLATASFAMFQKAPDLACWNRSPAGAWQLANLWNDGRIEAVINNLSDRPMLLVNEARNDNHWLALRLMGVQSNRDAIGARVSVRGEKRTWVDEVRSGSSYNSSSSLILHFGLGSEQHLKGIEVRWPNGAAERFDAPSAVDQAITLTEGNGHATP